MGGKVAKRGARESSKGVKESSGGADIRNGLKRRSKAATAKSATGHGLASVRGIYIYMHTNHVFRSDVNSHINPPLQRKPWGQSFIFTK